MNWFAGLKTQRNVVITHEDIDRAHDRARVQAARSRGSLFSRLRLLWLLVGPGILVMLGENDGPSMLSYAATGAKFGIGFFLPFIILTFAMAIVVQEMTVRLGTAHSVDMPNSFFLSASDLFGAGSPCSISASETF
jgi:hypothetical protein